MAGKDMDEEVSRIAREMRDRHEIYDCIMRYCRGIDRFDREVLLSAYHSDAIDDHGTYCGSVEGFADYAFALHATQHRTQHHITNHRCEIDGDIAHAESYYIFWSLNKEEPLYTTSTGRYIDRFERRDGRWAIAERVCLVEIRNEHWAPSGFEGDTDYVPAVRDRSDPSYLRPLRIDHQRFSA